MQRHVSRRVDERQLLKARAVNREQLEHTTARWEREQMRSVLSSVRLNHIQSRA
jgi:hypothetical protein